MFLLTVDENPLFLSRSSGVSSQWFCSHKEEHDVPSCQKAASNMRGPICLTCHEQREAPLALSGVQSPIYQYSLLHIPTTLEK